MLGLPRLQAVCGRCGKPRTGLRHTCIAPDNRRATVKLGWSSGKCGKCKRTVTNPLTHTCVIRTDFKRRKSAFAKRQKAASRKRDQHLYQSCRDSSCQRQLCIAFREGFGIGNIEGFDSGYETGFIAGQNSCPLPHGGSS